MVCLLAILIPTVLTLVCGVTIFFENNVYHQCSPAPPLAGWITAIAVLDILWIVQIFPEQRRSVPLICRLFVETLATVAIFEFCTFYVWCHIEATLCITVQYVFVSEGMSGTFDTWERPITGAVTTLFSLALLIIALRSTDHIRKIRRRICPQQSVLQRRVCP